MTDTGKTMTALLIGLAAGATLGLLFAPDKGSAIRRKIAGYAEDAEAELLNTLEKGKNYVKDTFAEGKASVNKLSSDVRDKAEEMKDKGKAEYEDVKSKARQHTSNI